MRLNSHDPIDTKYYSAVDNIKNGKYPLEHLPVIAEIEIYEMENH